MCAGIGTSTHNQKQKKKLPRALGVVVGGDDAAVFLDDLLHDRKAEAGALGFGGDVGFEQLAQQLGGKTRTVVGDPQFDVRKIGVFDATGGEGNATVAAFGQRVERILDEIVEQLADAAGVDVDAGQLGIEVDV